ncbi:NADPH-dependent FMN reductase [Leptospira sp. 'Mane']|uniref:NADPH-dependent FMN reductase n=1 Tax=Leptospira sp. 'Mane' TaxID=3387407 RepID=UPI00398AB2DE
MVLKNANSDSILRLGLILGSNPGFGELVANWFTDKANSDNRFEVDQINLLDHLSGKSSSEISSLAVRIAAADAFVVITPAYNHNYLDSLKLAIGSFDDEWNAKPMGFISYGEMPEGDRTMEQLRLVFAELRVATIRDSISFSFAHTEFEDGSPVEETRFNGAVKSLLNELAWWGHSFRNARMGLPYPVIK